MIAALIHSPLALFIVQAALIIALSRVVGLLAARIGQPMVIAEVAGRDPARPVAARAVQSAALWRALFPQQSLPMLGMFSQVGLDPLHVPHRARARPEAAARARRTRSVRHQPRQHHRALSARRAARRSYLYPRLSSPDVPFSSFVLFMGVSMSITAFPVLARILAERRLLQTKLGALAITCAAVDDVTAWCLLAFVVSVAKSPNVTARGAHRRCSALDLHRRAWSSLVRPFLRRLGAVSASREGLTQNLVAVTLLHPARRPAGRPSSSASTRSSARSCWAPSCPRTATSPALLAEKLEDLVVVLLLPAVLRLQRAAHADRPARHGSTPG